MLVKNTNKKYGVVSVIFHWGSAIYILLMLILGWVMTNMPAVGFDTTKIKLILLHKAFGILFLLIVSLRMLWRLGNKQPAFSKKTPSWQKIIAIANLILLYFFMFALPVSGWVLSSAYGLPISFFGLFTLPPVIAQNQFLGQRLITMHYWLGVMMVGFIFFHVLAALYHHFYLKDGALKKISWVGSQYKEIRK